MKNLRTLIAASLVAATGSAIAQVEVVDMAAPLFNANWQSTEVQAAFNAGYTGQGTRITVVDEYRATAQKLTGRMLASGLQSQTHGYWTSEEAGLTAPGATIVRQQFATGAPIALAPKGLNVINASYGMMATYGITNVRLGGTETSMVNYAKNGQAVVVKAAGNDAVNMLSRNAYGQNDYLSTNLKGAQSAIFVGALDRNGSVTSKANIASYSNRAGTDAVVQKQFLMAGVAANQTGLAGTSFAAPIVSGYAAVLGSKFKTAGATQITNQLLNTARTDTINGYNVTIHGRGEASLGRALAPVAIK
jgi:subtilisin family serine protease